jgi:hypothetical protein
LNGSPLASNGTSYVRLFITPITWKVIRRIIGPHPICRRRIKRIGELYFRAVQLCHLLFGFFYGKGQHLRDAATSYFVIVCSGVLWFELFCGSYWYVVLTTQMSIKSIVHKYFNSDVAARCDCAAPQANASLTGVVYDSFGSSHGATTLRQKWRAHFNATQLNIPFQRVRFHGTYFKVLSDSVCS